MTRWERLRPVSHYVSCLHLFLSFFPGHQAPSTSCINVWELEQPIGHGRGAHGRPSQAGPHRGEVGWSVEAVFEFRQVARHVLLVDGRVSPDMTAFMYAVS